MEYVKVLKKYFGFDTFRDKQLEVINALLKYNRDVCVVMFTGSGKSLCFQFPAVYTNRTIIVVSPLISLMNDQQMKLNKNNISTCCLNGTVGNKSDIKSDIINGKYRLIYITPEYLITQENFIKQLYEKKLLIAVAIDEAHCASMWGNDFRQAYKGLNCIKEWMPDIPTIALTATATPKVQQDIIKILKLKNPLIIKTTFDRPNLIIKVLPKLHNPVQDILPLIKNNEPTIIYCQTRKMTDDISYELKKKKIICGGYHAGMSTNEREKVHKKFATNKLNCVVATIAFGMGIDSVIRKVIHYGIPKDMESYYQEIGRAGRDGKSSECILFYSMSDMNTNNYFINQISSLTYRNHMVELALSMKNYIYTYECRRKYILGYFGEKYNKNNCALCDNCLNNKKDFTYDFTREGKLLIQLINETGNTYGKTIIINILRGSNSKKIPPKFKKIQSFGSGTFHTENWWKIFFTMLINHGYIKENPIAGGNSFTLSTTKKSFEWLESNNKLILSVPDEMQKLLPIKHNKVKLPDDINDIDNEILDELLESIKDADICKKTPLDITYNMFQNEHKTIDEIANDLNVKKMTIEEHLNKLDKKGYKLDLNRLNYNNDIYTLISNKIKELNYPNTLKTIKDELPKNISYLHIKLTQNRMQKNDKINETQNNTIIQKYNMKHINKIMNDSKRNWKIDKEYDDIIKEHILF